MKKKIAEVIRSRKFVGGIAAVALAVIVGGTAIYQQTAAPELPVYDADPIMETSLEEEETPLASAPVTTTKTTKKTSKKNVKLSKASAKTYSKKFPTTKKTTSKTSTSSTKKVVTKTTVSTAKTEKYTKKSKVKVVTTTVTTTVKTTTTKLATTTATANKTSTTKKGKYEVSVTKIAPKADSRILSAFQQLGFKVYVDSSVSYSGYFDAASRSITMKAENDVVYHELGHFLAFVAGNADKTTDFKNIYTAEKSKFTGTNKAYATQNSSEYFAESYRDYVVNTGVLKSSRPKTYSALTAALNKLTTEHINKVQKVYAVVWR